MAYSVDKIKFLDENEQKLSLSLLDRVDRLQVKELSMVHISFKRRIEAQRIPMCTA